MRLFILCTVLIWCAVPLRAQSSGNFTITPIITGLDAPWAVAPLPKGGALVTEKGGQLLYVRDNVKTPLPGVPRVFANGQGGLLDVTLAHDFAQSRDFFLTYAKPVNGGAALAVARGQLGNDGALQTPIKDIYVGTPGLSGGIHFGSRVVSARDGTLFVSHGERRKRDLAQDLSHPAGSILRINRDGAALSDNPFVVQADARPEIWSYGHRNPQGMDIDGQGRLWISEHGAKGGDEVNLIEKGTNYGWPVISYGREYSGGKIGEGTAKEGMAQPEFYWDPSIAPSGLLAYDGKLIKEWKGDILVGSLKFDYISRLRGNPLREVEQIKTPETLRVRDIVAGPDGAIWFVSEGNGTVYTIRPSP